VAGGGNLLTTLTDQIQWERLVQRTPADHPYYEAIRMGQSRIPDRPYLLHHLTNSGKTIPADQTRRMADAYFGLDDRPSSRLTEPETVGPYVSEEDIPGVHLTPANYLFEFLRDEEGRLQLNRVGRGKVELERESANVFRQKYDSAFKQEFTRLANGDVQVTAYYPTHDPYSLVMRRVDWTGYDFSSLNGSYLSPETGVTLEIEHTDGRKYAAHRRGSNPTTATLTDRRTLLFDNYVAHILTEGGMALDFGRVRGLRLVAL
jgi:hypothetical protein